MRGKVFFAIHLLDTTADQSDLRWLIGPALRKGLGGGDQALKDKSVAIRHVRAERPEMHNTAGCDANAGKGVQQGVEILPGSGTHHESVGGEAEETGTGARNDDTLAACPQAVGQIAANPVRVPDQKPRAPVLRCGRFIAVVPGQAFPGRPVEPFGDIVALASTGRGHGAGGDCIHPVAGAFERIARQGHPAAIRLGECLPLDVPSLLPKRAETGEQHLVIVCRTTGRRQGGKRMGFRPGDPAHHGRQGLSGADFDEEGVRIVS